MANKKSISRKGVSRRADIPPSIRKQLNEGLIETATLAEGLAIDFATLLRSSHPKLKSQIIDQIESASSDGIVKRMALVGSLLFEQYGPKGIIRCQSHTSDTVRGWACYMVAAHTDWKTEDRLLAIRPLADDDHFGVREWAWIAVRPQLASDLDRSIEHLAEWAHLPSERLRRFASESLRPRGVWCSHIPELKENPGLALPILDPLRADPSKYVQDSVANWLNDAGKSKPDWVKATCNRWMKGSSDPATQRICHRALRNLR
ncbi:DNA alkylation repair protein [bacterium]|nr:DNA alkylation repair protein [bacterium]